MRAQPGPAGPTPEFGPAWVRRRRPCSNGSRSEHGRGDVTPEQIIRKLRDADRLLGEGQELPVVVTLLEVSEATYHRCRVQYGGDQAPFIGSPDRESCGFGSASRRRAGSCTVAHVACAAPLIRM